MKQKNTVHPFRFTYLTDLKRNWILPFSAIPLFSWWLISECVAFKRNYGRDMVLYLVYYENSGEFTLLYSIVVVLMGMILSFTLLRRALSKQSANVYLSLGITRRNVFFSKFLVAMTLLGASIFIPLFISLIYNLCTFGYHAGVLQAFAYFGLSFLIVGCIGFSVTAAVLSLVGAFSEGLFFSAIFLGAPTVFLYALPELIANFIYKTNSNSFTDGVRGGYSGDLYFELSFKLASQWNPLHFYFQGGEYAASKYITSEIYTETYWHAPRWATTLLWLCIALLLTGLAARCFQKRKAEISGFLGKNRALTILSTAVVGVVATAVFLVPTAYTNSGATPYVLLAILAVGVLFLALTIIQERSFAGLKKRFWELPLHAALCVLMAVSFTSGFFGQNDRFPHPSAVYSASVTPVADIYLLGQSIMQGGDYNYRHLDSQLLEQMKDAPEIYMKQLYLERPVLLADGFQQIDEIKKIIQIDRAFKKVHKRFERQGDLPAVAKDRLDYTIQFRYELYNGFVVSHYYTYTTAQLMEELALLQHTSLWPSLWQTYVREETAEYRRIGYNNMGCDYLLDMQTNIFQNKFSLMLYPTHLNRNTQTYNLSGEQRKQLLDALRKDLLEQKPEKRLFPTKQPLGYLQIFQATEGLQNEIEISNTYESTDLFSFYNPYCPISADMRRTVEFLRQNDLLQYFKNDSKYTSVRLYPARHSDDIRMYESVALQQSMNFLGQYWSQGEDSENDYPAFILPKDAVEVTDAQLIQQLEEHAHLTYFNSRQGYIAQFNAPDGGKTFLYIAAENIPEPLKGALASAFPT